MHNSIKGVLWSGLVFPGLGEVVLKHYYRGLTLMLTVSVCMALMVMKIVQQANDVLDKIESTGLMISTDNVANMVIESMPSSGGPSYRILLFITAGCWLVSVVDVFLLGRQRDAEEKSPGPDLTDSIEMEAAD